MTAAPWVTLEPGQTERAMGILLCRRYPSAQRIQPAQGDGGLDVIVPHPDGRFDNYKMMPVLIQLSVQFSWGQSGW